MCNCRVNYWANVQQKSVLLLCFINCIHHYKCLILSTELINSYLNSFKNYPMRQETKASQKIGKSRFGLMTYKPVTMPALYEGYYYICPMECNIIRLQLLTLLGEHCVCHLCNVKWAMWFILNAHCYSRYHFMARFCRHYKRLFFEHVICQMCEILFGHCSYYWVIDMVVLYS